MKNLPVMILGFILTLLCVGFYMTNSIFVQTISNKAYDLFIARVHRPTQTGRVAIIDIDEKSLQKFGQFPWPRYLVAKLTEQAFAAGASVLAYDVLFAETDRTSPERMVADLKNNLNLDVRLEGVPSEIHDFDRILASALKKGNSVLGCMMHPADQMANNADLSRDPFYRFNFVPKTARKDFVGAWDPTDLMQAGDVTLPIAVLNEACHTAFFNAVPDLDGILRSNPLIYSYGASRIYPSLALESVILDQGVRNVMIYHDDQGVVSIRLGKLKIPTDEAGRIIINYRTLSKNPASSLLSSFPTYSAMDVISGAVGSAELANKIVFVGTSATGLKDIKASPLTQFFSGVEVHATIVDNILAGDVLNKPSWAWGAEVCSILIVGVFLTFLIAHGRSWLSFLATTGLAAGSIGLSLWLMANKQLVLVPAWVVVSILFMYVLLTMVKFWQEERQRKKVRNMFGTMVSPQVLRYLEKNPGSFSLTGEKAEATMFFSDVAGFTTISESLSPDKLSNLLNHYLSPMTEIIMSHGGYVDKYEGDAIMAEWGVPFPMEDHAVHACWAALEQQEKLSLIRPILKEKFGHELRVRMGLNSGSVTAGNMGSDKRFQYTVMGDAVNQAARFEPANKDYGTLIMMGETTYQLARESIEARLLDRIVVKGKTKPISIYELLSKKGGLAPTKAQVIMLYEKALRAHWDRGWDEACSLLKEALALDPDDGPSARLYERIEAYRETPPDSSWSGEYVRKSKD